MYDKKIRNMSEYRFRAWWSNTMCEVDFIDFEYRECGLKYWGEAANDWIRRTVNFEDIKLMQFAGLHDKNGKEIYEGDIVTVYDIERTFKSEILYHEDCFCVRDEHQDYPQCMTYYSDFEVIGNIYDNPELLKAGE